MVAVAGTMQDWMKRQTLVAGISDPWEKVAVDAAAFLVALVALVVASVA